MKNSRKSRFVKLSVAHWDALIYPHTVSPFGGYSDSLGQYEENLMKSIADVLARLWSVFGEPSEYFDGEFDYYLFDNLLGIPVCVNTYGRYWIPTHHHREAIHTVHQLSKLLAESTHCDCTLVIFKWWKIGVSGGVVFAEKIDNSNNHLKGD